MTCPRSAWIGWTARAAQTCPFGTSRTPKGRRQPASNRRSQGVALPLPKVGFVRPRPRVRHPPKCTAGARGERAWWPLPFQRQASNLGGMNNEWLKRITVEEGKCGGRPCIRGLRIRVSDILELLAAGASFQEILSDYPSLEREDIIAAIEYAAHQTDHAVLQAL